MDEGDSVREMQGTETGPGGGVTPRSLSPGLATHTQGAPRQLAGEVVSATQHVDEVKWIKKQAFTKQKITNYGHRPASLSLSFYLFKVCRCVLVKGLPYNLFLI